MRQLNDRNYYQKLDKNPTVDHEKLVNNTINDLLSENAIDEDTASLLHPSKSRIPKFYMLQKIHKEGMPGHPVVSSVSSPTEKISAFVDEFLKPMAQELPSYMKDTTHFLQKIDKVGEISEDTYMVTLDVKSLYTNIDNEEGSRVFKEELEKRSVKNTPSFAYEAGSHSQQLRVQWSNVSVNSNWVHPPRATPGKIFLSERIPATRAIFFV